mmetsp:Transcript_2695/g.5771  ORF Transcript_2695/g.5771 Transcript_2695/m.5771 type:complete len:215 (+) Transcript_2695:322-966(+)
MTRRSATGTCRWRAVPSSRTAAACASHPTPSSIRTCRRRWSARRCRARLGRTGGGKSRTSSGTARRPAPTGVCCRRRSAATAPPRPRPRWSKTRRRQRRWLTRERRAGLMGKTARTSFDSPRRGWPCSERSGSGSGNDVLSGKLGSCAASMKNATTWRLPRHRPRRPRSPACTRVKKIWRERGAVPFAGRVMFPVPSFLLLSNSAADPGGGAPA